jgi:hypothetical protein
MHAPNDGDRGNDQGKNTDTPDPVVLGDVPRRSGQTRIQCGGTATEPKGCLAHGMDDGAHHSVRDGRTGQKVPLERYG